MDLDLIGTLVSLLLQVLLLIIAGVWAIGKINAAAEVLRVSLDNLAKSVEHLRAWLDQINERLGVAVERIAVIETKIGDLDCHRDRQCYAEDKE